MLELLESELITINKPARYIGNELGIPDKDFINSPVRFLISYPDVYEVGMCNQGIKIIYDIINQLDFASCERVFSPWVDFEELLRKKNIPIFSLETQTPINKFDIIGFSIQYELLFTNFLNLLDLGKIEIFSKNRQNDSPIIICGGPAIVNPKPYTPFVDLFFIGEAEESLEKIINKYYSLKKENVNRDKIIEELSEFNGVYSPKYSKNIIKRQIYNNFTNNKGLTSYLIPNIDIIQNKLVIEIMRGCPNKCRFCQAGIIYKPYREKNINNIIDEVEDGITSLGVNEVTFSSLSSGDFSRITELSDFFNQKYKDRKISFSLPSLRVESFDIDLIEKISLIRKSGLTFAIESGSINGQCAINKIVMKDKIIKIIEYALKHGWKSIKLYFMIGLPDQEKEVENITDFVDEILTISKKLYISLNIATFVPKPHTPYQYKKQLPLDDSIKIYQYFDSKYKKTRVKIKKHNPYMSYIEGFIARGDEKVGQAIYSAYQSGAKFDGWDDHFKFDIYKNIFSEKNITYDNYLNKKNINCILPWNNIDIGLNKEYLIKEINKSKKKEITKSCKEECEKDCNICSNTLSKKNNNKIDLIYLNNNIINDNENDQITRYFLEFSKNGMLKYIGHIDLLKYFEKLFIRNGIDLLSTQGFNPKPKLQFSSALSLGVESTCELLEFYTKKLYKPDELLMILKNNEHKNIPINKLKIINSKEKYSLMDKIEFTEYQLQFDPSGFNNIKSIIDTFNKSNPEYIIIKKGKTYTGFYKDFIEIYELTESKFFIRIKSKSSTPNIIFCVTNIFINIKINITKQKMYFLKNGIQIKLYDLYD